MKKQYSTPSLTTHGDVAEITQILGSSTTNDFLYFNGSQSGSAGQAPDQGSKDLCLGTTPQTPNCGDPSQYQTP